MRRFQTQVFSVRSDLQGLLFRRQAHNLKLKANRHSSSVSWCLLMAVFFLGAVSLHRETLSVPAASSAAATVTVTAPNGGEVLSPTTNVTIRWTATGVATQKLHYSLDGGTTWTLIYQPYYIARTYNWKPICKPTTTGRIKVEVFDGGAATWISDTSNGNFTIRSPADTQLPTMGAVL